MSVRYFDALDEIGIELTNRCNLLCLHCMRESNGPKPHPPGGRRDFDLSLLRRLLTEAREFGIHHVAFTGGEPTLHPRFAKACDIVSEAGMTFHFVTNGTTFERILPNLLKHKGKSLSGVSISIDGAAEETHDYIRGKGNYRQVMKAAMLCHAYSIPFSFQMVVMRCNWHEIEPMALLASKLGAQRLFYAYLQPTPETVTRNLTLTPDECRQVKEQVMQLMASFKLPILLSPGFHVDEVFFNCRALKVGSLNVNHYGHLTLCCQLSGYTSIYEPSNTADIIADLNTTSLREAMDLLIERIAQEFRDRLKVMDRERNDLDYYPCLWCARYHGKLDWLDKMFPENAWARPEGQPERCPKAQTSTPVVDELLPMS